ncbi:MAG: lysine transporter LysE [Pseudomonadales bacterium RIFCSPHIGHO2_12_FULL_40_16]|uniref:LysE family translocator n=1 Tax=Acinetobacter johnsonii TaxID=40214 RepID=UPI0008C0BE52|nr:LysE family transporter [Acinetobacter johnsonii]MCF7642229.1 LysE family transporter [Acinetobacter johnsonii]OFW78014.1 MAG: lysine transporter LysE [Acinetobacter sp. RIFCSPHIGHO2_12_41_5]OHC22838.1 MAG: lysine transporter LysE [Pseudomonadales bacterium RIFCSPHIGHO2_12_FULL_40_16]
MNEIIAIAIITLLTVINPGADFALVSRNSYLYGRKQGIYTAYGIACAVWIHISYSVLGLSFLKHYIPNLLHIIQYIGALYLMYIGYKTFTQQQISDHATHTLLHPRQAFIQGFLGNSLNPKTTLFVMSIFAQLLRGNHGLMYLIGYGMFISASHLLWFLLISLFCSTPVIRNKILRKQVSINRVIGTVLATLGLCLFLTN